MGLFTYLWRSSRGVFALAILAGVISGGTGAAFIAVVNLVLRAGAGGRGALIAVYVGMCLATVVTRVVSQVLLYRLSQGVIYRLRRHLIDRILAAPLRDVERTGTPRLYSGLSDDIVVIGQALPGLPAVCSSAAFVIVALVYLATVSLVVAGATMATTVVGVAIYRLFARYGTRFLGAAREDQDRLFEHFRAVTEGIKELKLNRTRREALAGRDLDATAASFRHRSVVGLSVFEGATGSGQAAFFGLIAAVLFAFPSLFGLSAQVLSESVLTLLFTVASLQSVLVWLPVLGRASVALRSVRERAAALAPEPASGTASGTAVQPWPDPAATPQEPRLTGAAGPVRGSGLEDWRQIDLCGVSHVYPGPAGEEFVLGPLDLRLHRGEIMFVVGGNGSGKTTMAKVLTNLYLPESGIVRVDGTPITAGNREAYRQLFSAIFADFFVFDSLVGLPCADRTAKAREYLARLQLDHKVDIVDDRFSTTALSQGQRKRLALLAAYLEDRSCYVFDEWAADQDPLFKEFFYRDLLAELKSRGKSVVVISHDDRYFPMADRLVRFDYGQIREEVTGGHNVFAHGAILP